MIVYEAARWGFRMLLFLGAIAVILFILSTSL